MRAVCRIHFGDLNQTIHILNEENDIVNTYKVKIFNLPEFFSKLEVEQVELMGPFSFCLKVEELANKRRQLMYENLTPIKFIYTEEGAKE